MIETKFNLGDKVWVSDHSRVNEFIQCPDCLGSGIWSTTLPNGETFPIECPTCAHGYEGSRGFISGPLVYGPKVWEGTVGSIGVDTYSSRPEERVRYMLNETGVGSGTIYYEFRIFPDRESALAEATLASERQNKQVQDSFIEDLKRKKRDRPGSLIAYLRTELHSITNRGNSIKDHLAKLQKGKKVAE
jgi:hypothetical protein